MQQAHEALGAKLQGEQTNSAQLNSQLQGSLADAETLRRTIAGLELQVRPPLPALKVCW